MKNERPCGARHKYKRRALRTPRGTTANRATRRECESSIGPPCGARREYRRRALRNPRDTTANPAARRERSRKPRAHADGGTRHRASSHRWHRAISPGRGIGSRGATVGRPSAHCASPGRHSGPRSRQAHRPYSKAPTAWATAPPVQGKANRGDPRTLSPSMKAQTA